MILVGMCHPRTNALMQAVYKPMEIHGQGPTKLLPKVQLQQMVQWL